LLRHKARDVTIVSWFQILETACEEARNRLKSDEAALAELIPKYEEARLLQCAEVANGREGCAEGGETANGEQGKGDAGGDDLSAKLAAMAIGGAGDGVEAAHQHDDNAGDDNGEPMGSEDDDAGNKASARRRMRREANRQRREGLVCQRARLVVFCGLRLDSGGQSDPFPDQRTMTKVPVFQGQIELKYQMPWYSPRRYLPADATNVRFASRFKPIAFRETHHILRPLKWFWVTDWASLVENSCRGSEREALRTITCTLIMKDVNLTRSGGGNGTRGSGAGNQAAQAVCRVC
jgi:hypothetical protein